MVRPKVYPEELRERAVRLLQEWRQARDVTAGGYTAVSKQLEPGLARQSPRCLRAKCCFPFPDRPHQPNASVDD
jgi:hypothetical protein